MKTTSGGAWLRAAVVWGAVAVWGVACAGARAIVLCSRELLAIPMERASCRSSCAPIRPFHRMFRFARPPARRLSFRDNSVAQLEDALLSFLLSGGVLGNFLGGNRHPHDAYTGRDYNVIIGHGRRRVHNA